MRRPSNDIRIPRSEPDGPRRPLDAHRIIEKLAGDEKQVRDVPHDIAAPPDRLVANPDPVGIAAKRCPGFLAVSFTFKGNQISHVGQVGPKDRVRIEDGMNAAFVEDFNLASREAVVQVPELAMCR